MAPALAALGEISEELRGNPEALLTLLRELEALHRDVQDGPFRQSLPENRQKLFTLLQGMEKNGGWPTAVFLHPLQKCEQFLAVFRKALAERTVLNVPMQGFKLTQQGEECFWISPQFL